jgi:hypothetical protein
MGNPSPLDIDAFCAYTALYDINRYEELNGGG